MMLESTTATIPEVAASPGFRLVTSETLDLTSELLKDFRAIPASPIERHLNLGRVKHLREKADAGRLVSFLWATATYNSNTVRINGQHSSAMLTKWLEEKGSLPRGLRVHKDHYEAENGDAMALLFQQFDDRKSGRTPNDVAAVYQGLQPDLAAVDGGLAKLALDGYIWFQRNVERVPGPIGDMVYAEFRNKGLHPFIKWLAELHTGKTKELHKVPVAAAMAATYMSNESAARTFWEEVTRGGDPNNDTLPQTALDGWLLAIHDQKWEKPDKFGPGNVYQGCIHAWNASREGKSVSTIRWDIRKGNFFSIHE